MAENQTNEEEKTKNEEAEETKKNGRADGIAGKRARSAAKNLSFCALFAALCFVGTFVVQIPMPATGGYFNVGDIFVLLAGWILGPLYGAVAAGIGSMLADVVSGYAVFAPATLLIKSLDALAAYLVWASLKKVVKNSRLDILLRAVSAVAGEAVMFFGYFFFEAVILGLGMGAAGSFFGNAMQALVGAAGATAVVGCLYPVRPLRRFFPRLG